MKICSVCKVNKPKSEYTLQKTGKDGLRASCKTCEKEYRQKYTAENSERLREYHRQKTKAYRKNNPDKVRESKRKYYASDRGKACKKREDNSYIKSGKRALCEKRRATKPLSEARKFAKYRHAVLKRAANRTMSDFDIFVWQEAKDLCVLRKKHIGSEWQIDHILPVSKGGTNEYTNIQVVPAKWNKQKSNKHSEKYDFT